MPTQLGSTAIVVGQDIYASSVTQVHPLGEKIFSPDGRAFRYAYVQPSSGGATGQPTGATLVTGNVLQAPAQIANHLALTPTQVQAIGDTQVTVTLGATAAYANQYANGYVIVSTTPGNGYAYLVKSHPAAASAATLTLTLSDPFQIAITTSSRIDLQQNIYSGVIQAPVTTATGATVGVANFPIPATATTGAYGWIQVFGMSATLITGTPAVGNTVVGGNTAAAGAAAISSGTLTPIGYMLSTGVSGKNNAVFLTLD